MTPRRGWPKYWQMGQSHSSNRVSLSKFIWKFWSTSKNPIRILSLSWKSKWKSSLFPQNQNTYQICTPQKKILDLPPTPLVDFRRGGCFFSGHAGLPLFAAALLFEIANGCPGHPKAFGEENPMLNRWVRPKFWQNLTTKVTLSLWQLVRKPNI